MKDNDEVGLVRQSWLGLTRSQSRCVEARQRESRVIASFAIDVAVVVFLHLSAPVQWMDQRRLAASQRRSAKSGRAVFVVQVVVIVAFVLSLSSLSSLSALRRLSEVRGPLLSPFIALSPVICFTLATNPSLLLGAVREEINCYCCCWCLAELVGRPAGSNVPLRRDTRELTRAIGTGSTLSPFLVTLAFSASLYWLLFDVVRSGDNGAVSSPLIQLSARPIIARSYIEIFALGGAHEAAKRRARTRAKTKAKTKARTRAEEDTKTTCRLPVGGGFIDHGRMTPGLEAWRWMDQEQSARSEIDFASIASSRRPADRLSVRPSSVSADSVSWLMTSCFVRIRHSAPSSSSEAPTKVGKDEDGAERKVEEGTARKPSE
ncbi:unnamed protein product [Soboliphyme baturini]|uniref:Reverse transcriptase domain-containing protein n=1 Tax=Soboliphyme baturini TaxID=241478 RepID=A0A183IKU2_9BILA|nr:unnamed protein product [Soboliphyme baturini]